MTGKADFSEEEWKRVLEGPTSAGLVVIASDRGGSIRETFSMAKVYAEARQQHGDSQLLDEIVAAKPDVLTFHGVSPEQLKANALQNVQTAVGVLEGKASDEEIAEFKQFVLTLANHVAEARKEGFMGFTGERVSDAERQAIADVEAALG